MAPRTRRSTAAVAASSPDSINLNTGNPAATNGNQLTELGDTAAGSTKLGRGRPIRSSALSSKSTSSAPTPATTISESEYSTPATSNAVTPAPSVSTKPMASGSKSRSRIVVELPDVPQDSGRKPTGFGKLGYTRTRISRFAPNSFVEDSDDDDDELFDNDPTPDAVVARRLQREEDKKASQSHRLSSSTSRLRRSTRISSRVQNLDDHDSDDVLSVVAQSVQKTGINKDKDKAPTRTSTSKQGARRKRNHAAIAPDDDEEPFSLDSDEDDAKLSSRRPSYRRSAPLIKKPRISGPGNSLAVASHPSPSDTVPNTDDSDSDHSPIIPDDIFDSDQDDYEDDDDVEEEEDDDGGQVIGAGPGAARFNNMRRAYARPVHIDRAKKERQRLEGHHPELKTMWKELEQMPILKADKAEQPKTISRQLKPFQLEGLAWMKAMESMKWKGGLLGDEMGLGKTIQAVSLIMSDYPAKAPTLVLVPPVALLQWIAEIDTYTDKRLKTLVFHGTNSKAKNLSAKELKKYDVIMMSYNSLESIYRKQEKGFKRKDGLYKEKSAIHQIKFHRVILDEAHCIKTRTTMTAKACFALQVEYRWCLTGTPLQNRIGELFSLIRFLNIAPFASYFCKQCPCSSLEWDMNDDGKCVHCNHFSMRHVSVFNQELLNPIQKYGNRGKGKEAFQKLRLMTERIMLRRLKKNHTDSMELPVKEIHVDRQFFGEEENDFANSIMTNGRRKFDTYVAQGVLLNNYANIFGLIMQMRQAADHPDLILKKSTEGGQNVIVCCICDEPAEEAIRSRCKHDFCRDCAKSYINSQDQPDCPQCHIPLSIDLEQPEIEQDETLVKKSSIINRIKMENWTSSSKIELLVHELHRLRSDNASHKSIIFSQFTTMLQLIEWRLRRAGITTVMLDGSMNPAQRQASINHFMANVDVECFLVSLKAGGVALNLTEASRVFIVDPWWNPAAEWQSADRCHRIGQTRPCIIKRLCIEDSVESRMVLLQEKKTSMINSTINSDDAAMESLTPEDLQFLFRGS
ncbi:DNA repair protein RAD16 [Biscogniauxia mediterranea]|nr:DNA repair protein RAD16 [Biscogniauxia mediterranea]